ncbi:MAG TPA: helix-turn-helix domain-containing protein [Gemmataceae bacterium]|nr:helix-turn-helix domain-containing protein [Gemmataceae bacterium]
MPRTKGKPESASQPASALTAVNGPASEVLTLSEAAAYLRLPEADVLRLVAEQGLPTRRLGQEWRFLKAAIQDWLRTGAPPAQSNKEAWLALAGIWKDDPQVDEELKEIYQRRGQPMTEDEA